MYSLWKRGGTREITVKRKNVLYQLLSLIISLGCAALTWTTPWGGARVPRGDKSDTRWSRKRSVSASSCCWGWRLRPTPPHPPPERITFGWCFPNLLESPCALDTASSVAMAFGNWDTLASGMYRISVMYLITACFLGKFWAKLWFNINFMIFKCALHKHEKQNQTLKIKQIFKSKTVKMQPALRVR